MLVHSGEFEAIVRKVTGDVFATHRLMPRDVHLLLELGEVQESATSGFLNHFRIASERFRDYANFLRCLGGGNFPSIDELLERAEDLARIENCATEESHVLKASLLYPDGFLMSLAVELRKEREFAMYFEASNLA